MHNMAINKREMAEQLQALAAVMEELPDVQMTSVVLSSCAYMLESLGSGGKPLAELTALESSELMGGYVQVANCVDRFAEEARRQLGYSAAAELRDQAMVKLEQEKAAQERLHRETYRLQLESVAVQTEIRMLQQELAEAEKELAELQEVQANQKSRAALCAPEVLAELRQQTEAQEKELEQHETELTVLTRRKMELEAKLSAVCAAIEQLPLEHRTLLDQQLERESYLKRLQNIAEECSAENQLALKEQIEELEPRARELKETAQQLRGVLSKLQQCVTEYDEETEHLSTDVLNVVQQHMDQLQQLLPDHRETLREVQEAAGEMETSLKECTELREEYAVWFDLDRRPLDAWLKAIEMPEYTNLKEVLNLKESRRVTVLTKQITSALQELDRLLAACTAAIRKDQKDIERKANGR